jgi:hypothetical protein
MADSVIHLKYPDSEETACGMELSAIVGVTGQGWTNSERLTNCLACKVALELDEDTKNHVSTPEG